MKKIKINLKIVVFTVVILAGFFGCQKDFLNLQPYGKETTANFWKTEEHAIQARNALTNFSAREGIDGRGHMWFENCNDNLVTGRPRASAARIKNFNMSASEGEGRRIWSRMYQTIAIANGILKNVPDMKISDKVKNNVIGEAHFYRAFAYLWLAPWYGDNGPNGGIPIVTEKTPADELDQPRPKSVLANYDLIIEDMKKAADLLVVNSQVPDAEKGRPHKAAAYGFAARAALYAAQYDSKYFDIVLQMTSETMKLGGALYPDFAELFTIENNFSSEYIFSMLGNANDGSKFAGMSFQNKGWGYYNTWGYYQPTLELYNSFEEGDKRRAATILYPGEKITFIGREVTFAVSPPDVSSTSGMTFRKWMDPFKDRNAPGTTVNANGNNASSLLGLPLLRFADILLMRAEALIWSKGEGNSEAITLLNKIRKRAGLPQNSKATKEQLKNERRCELAFEFLPSRFVDLVRWKEHDKLQQPLHGIETVLKNGKISEIKEKQIWPARTFNPEKNHVFPIPAGDISSKFKLKQNKGY